jgi:hypothetical protein
VHWGFVFFHTRGAVKSAVDKSVFMRYNTGMFIFLDAAGNFDVRMRKRRRRGA